MTGWLSRLGDRIVWPWVRRSRMERVASDARADREAMLVTVTHVETCPKCKQRWAVRRVEPDRVHLMWRMKRQCWPVRMAGHLVDGLRAFLVAFGERLDGTSVDEVERHGG